MAPVDPIGPVEPVLPIGPGSPETPVLPCKPEFPVDPTGPVAPVEPDAQKYTFITQFRFQMLLRFLYKFAADLQY